MSDYYMNGLDANLYEDEDQYEDGLGIEEGSALNDVVEGLEPCTTCNGSGLVEKGERRLGPEASTSIPLFNDFKILRSHLLEELESEIIYYLNEGWTLSGNLHHVGYVDGTIEYMWGVVRKGKEAK